MDRGFGSFRGYSNGPNRQISDRRYDDFYSDGRRGGGGVNNRNSGPRRSGGDGWGTQTRDQGFFNQAQGRGSGHVGGQIVAALQQQQQNLLSAFMSSQQQPRGLLPAPRGRLPATRGRGALRGALPQQARRNDNRYGNRPGDKRSRPDQRPSGFQNKRKPPPTPPGKDRSSSSGSKKSNPDEKKLPPKEEEIDIPDDEVEVPDSLMDNVENLRQRKDVERNVADEDVKKLVVFCFTGKGYQCTTCCLLLTKESAFLNHLDGKTHVMNVIDARTAKKYQDVRDILDIDLSPDDWYEKNEKARKIILKQAKMFMKTQREIKQRDIDNYNKNPANFFTVNMETRKAAVKRGTTVIIKSIVETSMEVREFGSDRHFGCEFIKAVSGFNCRLCGLHINDSDGVIPHVESRLHKSNYQAHLRKTPGYEKVQTEQNNELSAALAENEERFVLLSETANAGEQTFLASMENHLVRVAKLFKPDPADKTTETEEDEEKEETAAETKIASKLETDTTTDNQDSKQEKEESDKAETEPSTEDVKEDDKSESAAPETEPSETTQDTSETTEVSTDTKPTPEGEGTGADATESVETEDSNQPEEAEPMETDGVNTEEEKEVSVANESEPGTEEVKKVDAPKPKKSILKKTPTRTGRGASTAVKRGRGRGAKASPRTPRTKKVKDAVSAEPEETEEKQEEEAPPAEEESNDGNFMDGFELVDEA